MNIKMKRYHPLLVALLLIAALLPLTMGNQRIVSYTLPDNFQALVESFTPDTVTATSGTPAILSDNSASTSIQVVLSGGESQSVITTPLQVIENQ